MRKYILSVLMCVAFNTVMAQEAPVPKWLSKAQKSILTVTTYDQQQQPLHEGLGYVISDDGVVVSEYALFKDAYSAEAVDAKGNKIAVEHIMGADNSYGLVKYRLATKKTTPLAIASASSLSTGSQLLAIGSIRTKVNVVPAAYIQKKDMIDDTKAYYTMDSDFGTNQVGCAAFTADGALVGFIQSAVDGKSGVADVAIGMDLSVVAIQNKNAAMGINNIHIWKSIPDNEQEALVYLYFRSSSTPNEEYLDLINQFVEAYPKNPEGYYRRATPLLDMLRFDEADADLDTYLKLADDKAQAHANAAQTIYSKLRYQPEPAYDKWSYDLALDHVGQAIAITSDNLNKETDEAKKTQFDNQLFDYTLQKAQILEHKGDHRAAIAIYDEVNAGPRKLPATFLASSLAHEAAGDSLDVVIALMDSAIAQFPQPLPQDAATYVMRRARLYQASKQYKRAVIDFNTFCYLNNNKVSETFYYDRAIIEVEAKMFQQALDDLQSAITISPTNPLYHVEKSAIHLRVNQIDECIESAKQCIKLAPDYPDAYRILGYAQIQKGDKASARANLEKAKALGDESAQEVMDKYLK